MDRNEFMELVYETFADEPDNVLANGIIEAADAYVEHEKAQLSQEGTKKDTTATPLTDKEQRIFLAAMRREEKVCKQVDEEWRDCRETHDDSLVRTCHEIERKVKGALWT